jgi:hypothetical protein
MGAEAAEISDGHRVIHTRTLRLLRSLTGIEALIVLLLGIEAYLVA